MLAAQGSIVRRWRPRRAAPGSFSLPGLLGLVALVPPLAWSRELRAQSAPPPAERLQVYSPYEEQTIDEVLAGLHRVRDPNPEGKIVERVDIVRLDVFEKRDVLPHWLNVFHVETRESVIRDEVLLREGQPFRQALVDDTVRNLRRLPGVPQLSTVLAIPTVGSEPDRVVLVVITKDVWSLRLNWNLVATQLSVTGGKLRGIEQLELLPAETNFLGTHQIVNLHFVLEPSAYTFGAGAMVPRIGDSRIAALAAANVMVNESGSLEGTYGSLVAGQPLFSGTTEWAWDSSVAWQDVVVRRYVNAQLSEYVDPATHQSMPFQYRSRTYTANYELTRSFGWDYNHDFTIGAAVTRAVYQNQFPGADPRTAEDFIRTYIPVSDTRVGPFLQYHTYEMRFLRVIDFDTLALQEDYRLGHDVVLRALPSAHALGSSRDVLELYGAAQYTWPMRDGLGRLSFASTLDTQSDRISDAAIQPTGHLVTPSLGHIGRLVFDASLIWRWRNYLNQTSILGGDDRLRGFPTNFFVGQDLVAYNVEFRSRPLEILSMELAGVAFFDAGDAFTGFDHLRPYQSAGVGVRVLFPWLDRTVFRADLGFPFVRPIDPSTGAPIASQALLISFGQAFSTPTVAPTPVLPTGQGPDSP